jgi:hypothetical protein
VVDSNTSTAISILSPLLGVGCLLVGFLGAKLLKHPIIQAVAIGIGAFLVIFPLSSLLYIFLNKFEPNYLIFAIICLVASIALAVLCYVKVFKHEQELNQPNLKSTLHHLQDTKFTIKRKELTLAYILVQLQKTLVLHSLTEGEAIDALDSAIPNTPPAVKDYIDPTQYISCPYCGALCTIIGGPNSGEFDCPKDGRDNVFQIFKRLAEGAKSIFAELSLQQIVTLQLMRRARGDIECYALTDFGKQVIYQLNANENSKIENKKIPKITWIIAGVFGLLLLGIIIYFLPSVIHQQISSSTNGVFKLKIFDSKVVTVEIKNGIASVPVSYGPSPGFTQLSFMPIYPNILVVRTELDAYPWRQIQSLQLEIEGQSKPIRMPSAEFYPANGLSPVGAYFEYERYGLSPGHYDAKLILMSENNTEFPSDVFPVDIPNP